MHITSNELAAASSAVAALAIVGGYLGVSSANRNAVKIAREERSAQRTDELEALKRAIYAKLLATIMALGAANLEQSALMADAKTSATVKFDYIRKRSAATLAAHDRIAELTLISPNTRLDNLANEAFQGATGCTSENMITFTRGLVKLRVALRYDLRGADIPSPDELNRMADNALANQPIGVVTDKTLPK